MKKLLSKILNIISTFVIVVLCVPTRSQVNHLNCYFYINPMLINPATCGADYLTKATLSHTKQWTNINQAPVIL
ncbi:MAG: type IX secretion system membrane protein PorP/SprF [Bacteroidales bacterium]|nr:type IX secretion system membrane protein PorP/SprF [Bacteroidales bacterium]MBN2819317.1 type IX secretion system membrane protein PorP/SprF [Bacteroidales bacterium]